MALIHRPGLSKHARMGFAIQAAQGTEFLDEGGKTEADLFIVPWNSNLDLSRNPNLEVYRQADYTDYAHMMFSGGEWFEGGLPISFQPVAATLVEMLDWITYRDAYNQGYWASIYLVDEWSTRSIMDAKVRRARISLVKGRPVDFTIEVVALGEGDADPTLTNVDISGPYLYNECRVQFDVGGVGSASLDPDFETLEINIDCSLEDPAEGLRITRATGGGTGRAPSRLYNLSDLVVNGSFTRDFVDAGVFTAWQAQIAEVFAHTQDASIVLGLIGRGVTTGFMMRNVRYIQPRRDYPGDNTSRIIVTCDFEALGDPSETPPADRPLYYTAV